MNNNYEIVFSKGLNTFTTDKLTAAEFTDFLTQSKSKGIPYSYDIKYNSGNMILISLMKKSLQ